MDFAFTEEQDSIRALAREILEGEVTADRQRAAETSTDWMDTELWARLAEANLLGLAVPEAQGGMGFGFLELCLLLEEAGRQAIPLPLLETLVLGGLPIAEFGSDAQRERWLRPMAEGKTILSAALPGVVGGSATVAARADGDGWVLEGAATEVPFAARAERIVVAAASPEGEGLFLVDPGAAGVSISEDVISTGQPLATLHLSGVRCEGDARLGSAGEAGWLRERALVAVAATQIGVSDAAIELTSGYVREREQFGVPIGSFQAVQHRAADAFIDLSALRWCTWRAAWRLAEGLPAAREAAVAKFWAADAGARISNACVHLHGGIGSDVDYPIHRHFLISKALELKWGAATPHLVWLGRDMARTGPEETV
ncbi:MAG: acyl-CoA/acyl-ACP dehydrogenase [Myxococcales bacterium]|nr:acyl-CoA/acyl-ACP dehydrogenase [Myxococcales bacterium]